MGKRIAPHIPHRGSNVEAWLKRERDSYEESGECWLTIDSLLDEYRELADTGKDLLHIDYDDNGTHDEDYCPRCNGPIETHKTELAAHGRTYKMVGCVNILCGWRQSG